MEPRSHAADKGEAQGFSDPLHRELHERIEELRTHHEDDFGRFHALDWTLIVLGCVLLPLTLYLWFRP